MLVKKLQIALNEFQLRTSNYEFQVGSTCVENKLLGHSLNLNNSK